MSSAKDSVSQNVHDPITEADRDVLGRQELAKTILERISQSGAGVFGIYGGWGTGKTSLLNLLYEINFEQEKRFGVKDICIQIVDAWKYESSDGLLMPIVARLKKLSGTTVLPEAWRVITRRALVSAAWSVTDALLKKHAGFNTKDLKEYYEESEKRDIYADDSSLLLEWKNWSDEVENTETSFKELVDFVLGRSGYKRIVICIDNLDRCSPENVVSLLESIKNFLSAPNCTWVFAMDADVISSYIDRKYEGTKVDGNSYLDKIIPEQYHLSLSPAMDGQNILRLLRQISGGHLADFDERNIPQIPKMLAPRRLIKSARKVSDFYGTRQTRSAAPELIFYLSLLYHAWPDFYQRLSSTSPEQIRGVLDNFFAIKEPAASERDTDTAKLVRKNIELDKKFIEDPDLAHFLKTTFKDYGSERFMSELIDGMAGLKLTGLP